MVSDLCGSTSRYPRDVELHRLIADLLEVSPRFAELWAGQQVTEHQESRKTARHPDVEIDCDVLTTQAGDLPRRRRVAGW